VRQDPGRCSPLTSSTEGLSSSRHPDPAEALKRLGLFGEEEALLRDFADFHRVYGKQASTSGLTSSDSRVRRLSSTTFPTPGVRQRR
jgi:hypothetical protein